MGGKKCRHSRSLDILPLVREDITRLASEDVCGHSEYFISAREPSHKKSHHSHILSIVCQYAASRSKTPPAARPVSRPSPQYIHHLKENEARNIEKWTFEKLLMDQAMGDLQLQLGEIRRMWEEERMRAPAGAKERVEAESGDGQKQRTE
ncbi:hypothetical protein B0H14DRAFT_3427193 [Mycena olivaceomarginata]|nr:hypothetical protein B0H14DRAFT_3427193 [Mycena olivaceomarginata]